MFARRQRRRRCTIAGRPARVGWHRLTSAHGRGAISAVPAGDARRAVQCDAAGLGVAACVFATSGCLLNSRMHKDARKSWNFPEGESTETVHRCSAAQRKAKRRHFVLCELSRLSLELNATHIHIFESVYPLPYLVANSHLKPTRAALPVEGGQGRCHHCARSSIWTSHAS